ncbi:hypothetical protein BV25DRAFT_1833614, partial [Artomyces pyxidatus]
MMRLTGRPAEATRGGIQARDLAKTPRTAPRAVPHVHRSCHHASTLSVCCAYPVRSSISYVLALSSWPSGLVLLSPSPTFSPALMARPPRPSSWVVVGSNPVFLDALEEHKKRLLPEELVDFDVSSPCVVIEDAKNLHADHRTKSRTRRCIERFSDLVRPLEALFSAIDSNVASNSQLAGIVWGAIRFVVK